jgi:threonine-phosphate decarboxylase
MLVLRASQRSTPWRTTPGNLLCADTALLSHIAAYGATWNVSVIAQEAGSAPSALGVGWKYRRIVDEEREFMTRALSRLSIDVIPSDDNFLLLKCERPLYEPLKARGILLRSCGNFIGLDARFVRIGLKTREKNNALIRAVEEIING